MMKSAAIAFFRSYTRHPLYALLNLLGLSFGIAAFITLSLLYRFETSYESWSPERPHIYAVGTRMHTPGISDDLIMATMGGLLEEMKSAWPQTEGTRDWGDYFIVHRGADVVAEHTEYVDPNFLTFFKMPLLHGNAATALADPSHVVLSASIARKYFGTTDVVGRTLTLGGVMGIRTYMVSAVIADLPKNSDMQCDMLVLMSPEIKAKFAGGWHFWGQVMLKTYLRFKSPADAAAFAGQLPAFIDRQAQNPLIGTGIAPHKILELSLVPLAAEHLTSPKLKAAIASLGLVGILALGLALINYVNLATARAGLRAREVAVRKTLGAPPPALRLQFLIEAVLTLLLAFLVALSAVELSLPLVNAAGGLSLTLDYHADAPWILGLLGCVLIAGLVAALYPALVLSAFKPAQVLASSRTPGGGRLAGSLRTGLAMLQFTVVVVAFILMAGFMLQIRHIQTADLGFQRDHMLIIGGMLNPQVTPAQREAFVTAARGLPMVRYVSLADSKPGDAGPGGFMKLVRPGHSDNATQAPNLATIVVGPDYFQMMGARLLAGRWFDLQHGDDQMWSGPDEAKGGRLLSVIISRGAAREMGFTSPQAAIGQTARFLDGQVRIIGVVEDMRFNSPNEAIPPKLYLFEPRAVYESGMIRYQGDSEAATRAALNKVWRHINPDVPLDAYSAAEKLDVFYKPERDRSHLFDIGTGIAALIGCIGLYGMAAFNASRRVREIGMRKVLGASRGEMVRLLLAQFLRPVAVASLIAWPVAWIALQRWLGQFDDAIAMPLWLFPSASLVALLIALVTVAGVAFAAAGTEPGRALRHE
jgi:putative ABC transport system permease protein